MQCVLKRKSAPATDDEFSSMSALVSTMLFKYFQNTFPAFNVQDAEHFLRKTFCTDSDLGTDRGVWCKRISNILMFQPDVGRATLYTMWNLARKIALPLADGQTIVLEPSNEVVIDFHDGMEKWSENNFLSSQWARAIFFIATNLGWAATIDGQPVQSEAVLDDASQSLLRDTKLIGKSGKLGFPYIRNLLKKLENLSVIHNSVIHTEIRGIPELSVRTPKHSRRRKSEREVEERAETDVEKTLRWLEQSAAQYAF